MVSLASSPKAGDHTGGRLDKVANLLTNLSRRNRLSLKTTLVLADQLLRRLGTLHSNQYLHRDIKPENFLLGTGERGNIVYMTDLGLAIYGQPDYWAPGSTPIRDVTARHPQLLGTCRYASIQGHLGIGFPPAEGSSVEARK